MHSDYKGPNFEDNIIIIDEEIAKRRNLWTLSSIQWLDWDDVSQIIRIHICSKWDLIDLNKPLRPYLNKIIAHQIKNLIRNVYGNYVRPCQRCCASEGENLCKLYSLQCGACPLYASWEKCKKGAYNVKMTLPLESHVNSFEMGYNDEQNILDSVEIIHKKMREILKPSEWKVYKLLFIDNLSEEEAAIKMGYKSNEVKRRPGYKMIKNLRKTIINKVKKALHNNQIDIR